MADVDINESALEEKVRQELLRIGLMIETETKRRCPVDTGRLRASYTTFIDDDNKVIVGSPVEYSKYVEFGTSKMAAQPHLRPALDFVRSQMKSTTI